MTTGTNNETIATLESERAILLRRTFDATPEEVFDALTDPDTIGDWWGPDGFRTTTHEMDVRPGGMWRFTMHGPDGTDYPNVVIYRAVERPRRLEYDHGSAPDKIEFEVTIELTDRNGGTELSMRSVFPTAAARDRVVKEVGALEGGKQTLARLANHLAAQRAGGA